MPPVHHGEDELYIYLIIPALLSLKLISDVFLLFDQNGEAKNVAQEIIKLFLTRLGLLKECESEDDLEFDPGTIENDLGFLRIPEENIRRKEEVRKPVTSEKANKIDSIARTMSLIETHKFTPKRVNSAVDLYLFESRVNPPEEQRTKFTDEIGRLLSAFSHPQVSSIADIRKMDEMCSASHSSRTREVNFPNLEGILDPFSHKSDTLSRNSLFDNDQVQPCKEGDDRRYITISDNANKFDAAQNHGTGLLYEFDKYLSESGSGSSICNTSKRSKLGHKKYVERKESSKSIPTPKNRHRTSEWSQEREISKETSGKSARERESKEELVNVSPLWNKTKNCSSHEVSSILLEETSGKKVEFPSHDPKKRPDTAALIDEVCKKVTKRVTIQGKVTAKSYTLPPKDSRPTSAPIAPRAAKPQEESRRGKVGMAARTARREGKIVGYESKLRRVPSKNELTRKATVTRVGTPKSPTRSAQTHTAKETHVTHSPKGRGKDLGATDKNNMHGSSRIKSPLKITNVSAKSSKEESRKSSELERNRESQKKTAVSSVLGKRENVFEMASHNAILPKTSSSRKEGRDSSKRIVMNKALLAKEGNTAQSEPAQKRSQSAGNKSSKELDKTQVYRVKAPKIKQINQTNASNGFHYDGQHTTEDKKTEKDEIKIKTKDNVDAAMKFVVAFSETRTHSTTNVVTIVSQEDFDVLQASANINQADREKNGSVENDDTSKGDNFLLECLTSQASVPLNSTRLEGTPNSLLKASSPPPPEISNRQCSAEKVRKRVHSMVDAARRKASKKCVKSLPVIEDKGEEVPESSKEEGQLTNVEVILEKSEMENEVEKEDGTNRTELEENDTVDNDIYLECQTSLANTSETVKGVQQESSSTETEILYFTSISRKQSDYDSDNSSSGDETNQCRLSDGEQDTAPSDEVTTTSAHPTEGTIVGDGNVINQVDVSTIGNRESKESANDDETFSSTTSIEADLN